MSNPRPVVVDLGKHKNKRVKALVRGEGPLMEEVDAVVKNLQAAGTIPEGAQPVVVVVRPKRRAVRMRGWSLGR